jgi:hypothetical protein
VVLSQKFELFVARTKFFIALKALVQAKTLESPDFLGTIAAEMALSLLVAISWLKKVSISSPPLPMALVMDIARIKLLRPASCKRQVH